MKRTDLNFAINASMTLCTSVIIGTGFLLKYKLIPGQDRWVKYGSNVELYFLNMDRHQWGSIHLILGFIFLGLLVLHIYLHWKTITSVYKRLIKKPLAKKVVAFLFIMICLLLIIIPLFIQPRIEARENGRGSHHMQMK